MVGAYLADEVAPAMHDHRPGRDQVEFVSAVAELNQLAGWMAYDVGDMLSGRRHLQQALQLCQRVSDNALSAEMLAGMSHQAAHARDGAVSVGLARAARDTAAGTGLAALESETAVMEAHGLALVCDKRGSVAALRDAEAAFSRADQVEHPSWLSYYDAAYLAAKMAHCMRELGDLRAAERFARRSLEMSAGYDRGKLFNTALLASIVADLREIEKACAVGRDALRLGRKLQSARARLYLQDFAKRLHRHQAVPVVAELGEELAAMGISFDAAPTA
ncbi:XRE family transcriptional regulator [Saccharopolyspora sp. NPDC000995]